MLARGTKTENGGEERWNQTLAAKWGRRMEDLFLAFSGIFLPREKARTEAIKKSPASLGFHQKEKNRGGRGGCCNSIRGTDEGGEIGVGAIFENRA